MNAQPMQVIHSFAVKKSIYQNFFLVAFLYLTSTVSVELHILSSSKGYKTEPFEVEINVIYCLPFVKVGAEKDPQFIVVLRGEGWGFP